MTIQKLPKVGMRGGEDQRENQRNIIVQEIERVMISQECTDSGKKKVLCFSKISIISIQ